MTTVYMPGLWDLLHVGHINALEQAKALGHILIVGVASDTISKEDKGYYPIISSENRLKMVMSLKCVDQAYVYKQLQFITHLNKFRPDILAVGSTWGSDKRHKDAEEWLSKYDRKKVVIPYFHETSTTEICKAVLANRKCNIEQ